MPPGIKTAHHLRPARSFHARCSVGDDQSTTYGEVAGLNTVSTFSLSSSFCLYPEFAA